jgi:CarboxypepD_reg-like domain
LLVRFVAVLLSAALFVVVPSYAADIRGKVTNALGGEPLARVQVSLLDTTFQDVTSSAGTFTITGVNPGKYTLRLSAVGYRLVTVPLEIMSATEVKEVEVNLAPDNFQRTDTVEVRGDVFQGGDSPTVTETNLTSSELKESSTVLADDPFRAVQSLPGVSAAGNNELFAEFSVMGAPFSQIGVYLDDVLIPPPFHNVPNQQDGASLSLLTSETVQEMKLLPVAYPEKFGDQIGAALDIQTREGSRTKPVFRAAPGIADSEFLGEGALGESHRGSWLASFRKSYIGWLVRNRLKGDFSDISFYDGDLKLSYDVAPGQNLNLYSLAGHTNVEVARQSDPFGLHHGASDFYFTRLGWRWSVTPHLLIDNRAAYIRQPVSETLLGGTQSHDSYHEWSGGTNVAWGWAKDHLLEGGWTLRRLSDSFLTGSVLSNGTTVFSTEMPVTLKPDAYVQESSAFFNNRLHLLAGVRYDAESRYPPHPFSPQASASLQIVRRTELQLGYARYTQYQFPPVLPNLVTCFGGAQTWDTSDHYTAAIETRAGENTRFRVQSFDRENVDRFHGNASPCGNGVLPARTSTFERDYSRGLQFVAQRRSSNRLSGWIGYTLVYARGSDHLQNFITRAFYNTAYFSTVEDQRNSLNVFATYRLKPSINFSGKFLYGSGFPIIITLLQEPNGIVVAGPVSRLSAYLRTDFRVDKSWAFTRWKLTLYGEVLNLTNHSNRIVTFLSASPNGGFLAHTAEALPITPTTGLAFEF